MNLEEIKEIAVFAEVFDVDKKTINNFGEKFLKAKNFKDIRGIVADPRHICGLGELKKELLGSQHTFISFEFLECAVEFFKKLDVEPFLFLFKEKDHPIAFVYDYYGKRRVLLIAPRVKTDKEK